MAFESLIDRIKMLGLEVNIIGDFNCNMGATLLESHTKKIIGYLQSLPISSNSVPYYFLLILMTLNNVNCHRNWRCTLMI